MGDSRCLSQRRQGSASFRSRASWLAGRRAECVDAHSESLDLQAPFALRIPATNFNRPVIFVRASQPLLQPDGSRAQEVQHVVSSDSSCSPHNLNASQADNDLSANLLNLPEVEDAFHAEEEAAAFL